MNYKNLLKKFRRILWAMVIILFAPDLGQSQYPAAEPSEPPEVFIFLIDVSGSMNDQISVALQPRLSNATKLAEVKSRVVKLVDQLPTGTRVVVSLFDHEFRSVGDVQLDSTNQRKELAKIFDSITSREGSTFLWRAADAELMRASNLVNQDGKRVRLVIYSDGEDMENNPNYSHKTLLAKHGQLISSSLKMDWVTIGFDLEPKIKKAFEEAGVNVVRAVDPEDLVPLRADVSISQLENLITVSDKSTGANFVEKQIDFGDGSKVQTPSLINGIFLPVIHKYSRPGKYNLQMTVRAANGRQHTCRTIIEIAKKIWQAPTVKCSPNVPVIGKAIQFHADRLTDGLKVRWKFSDGEEAEGQQVKWIPVVPGEMQVTLTATDLSGEKKSTVFRFTVPKPALPATRILVDRKRVDFGSSALARVEPVSPGINYDWSSDEGGIAEGPAAAFQFENPGNHQLTLTLRDQYGQSKTMVENILVDNPSAPKALFLVTNKPSALGQRLVAINRSSHLEGQVQWKVDGQVVSNRRDLDYVCNRYGEYLIELIVSDSFGQSDRSQEKVAIPVPPAPISKFEVSSVAIKVGDTVSVSDLSSGQIETVRYKISGMSPSEFDIRESPIHRPITFTPTEAGPTTITQSVFGPGGQHSTSTPLQVLPKWIKPIARFQPSDRKGKEKLEVRFVNSSIGDVFRCELDPGDGSQKKIIEGARDFVHAYGPGTWYAVITVLGPPDSDISPVIWRSEAIVIARPTPGWVKKLIWQIPVGLAFFGLGIAIIHRRNYQRDLRDAMRLPSELSVRSLTNPLQISNYQLNATDSIAEITLPDDTQVQIATIPNDFSGDVEFQVEIHSPDTDKSSIGRVHEDEEVEIGEYAITLTR